MDLVLNLLSKDYKLFLLWGRGEHTLGIHMTAMLFWPRVFLEYCLWERSLY